MSADQPVLISTSPQALGDPFLRRLIRGQNIGLTALFLMMGIASLFESRLAITLPLVGMALLVGIIARGLLQRGYFTAAGYVFFLGTSVTISVVIYLRGYLDASAMYYLWPILGAISILELQGGAVVLLVSFFSYFSLALAQILGVISPPVPYNPQSEGLLTIASIAIMFGLLSYLAWLASQNTRQALQRVEEAALEAQNLAQTLEVRIQERTAELEQALQAMRWRTERLNIVAEVTRAVSLLQDVDELLPQVVRLISERFGHYHVGIFLLDEKREYAVLRAANSEGGQRMLRRGHRLALGATSIVGYVASTARPRVASNVGEDVVWFNNPDLPQTASEMAVPLMVGERVIGVLDVQSTKQAAFSPEDVEVIRVLADQIAIALENARLFASNRRMMSEMQVVYGEYLRAEWSRLARQLHGVRYSGQKVESLTEAVDRPEIQTAAQSGQIVVVQEGEAALAIPLKVREQVVGVLHVRSANPRRWTEDELTLAQAVAERAVLALENARLLQEAQQRAQRERTIGEIAAKISSSVNLRNILQLAVEELGRVMPGAEVTVQIRK